VPGLVYLLGYLIVAPLLVYFPTHLLLRWWMGKRFAKGLSSDALTSNRLNPT
jgi:hypothetical protein